jgi:formylglycine-generating enzyme required for sulfatase activity
MFMSMRGGCWNYLVEYSRSAHRDKCGPGGRQFNIGFRVVHSADVAPVPIGKKRQ